MKFTPDQKEKIKGFKWIEDEQEGTEAQPGIAIAEDVIECSKAIASYVLENIKTTHYNNGHFVISIPLDIHRLLRERYNSNWTDDSRVKIFDLIKGVFSITVDSEKEILEDRINEIVMPTTAREAALFMLREHAISQSLDPSTAGNAAGQYKVKWAKLYDEPTMVMGDSVTQDQIVVEIEADNFIT